MATSLTPLLPSGDQFISLAEAKEMTERYRSQKENILAPQYQGKDILLISETFSKSAFEALLNVSGCAGIRIYYGMNPKLQVKAIGLAVDKDGNDILPDEQSEEKTEADDGGKIIEHGQSCPPYCPTSLL